MCLERVEMWRCRRPHPLARRASGFRGAAIREAPNEHNRDPRTGSTDTRPRNNIPAPCTDPSAKGTRSGTASVPPRYVLRQRAGIWRATEAKALCYVNVLCSELLSNTGPVGLAARIHRRVAQNAV